MADMDVHGSRVKLHGMRRYGVGTGVDAENDIFFRCSQLQRL